MTAEMDDFEHRNGALHAEDVPVARLAAEFGTPLYIYSASTIERRYRQFAEGLEGLDAKIFYSIKANSNQAVLKLLAGLGAGFDAVSAGEVLRARSAGAPGSDIVFSGVGKTRQELRTGIEEGIRHFNVESESELAALAEIAAAMGASAPVSVRVNPDVDAGTHEKISTGKSENKFGVPISRARSIYSKAASLDGVEIVGVDMHIGSQITSLAPFEAAFRRIADLVGALRADGHSIRRIDLGGGLGAIYDPSAPPPPGPDAYCRLVRRTLGNLGCEIEIEPGRYIVANAGLLVASVIRVKRGEGRRFLIVDAAMNDLLRPAMYGAYHEIVPVEIHDGGAKKHEYDVVGPVCESSDTFAVGRALPPLEPDDLVAFLTAGAYAASMASEYNTRPSAPEVLVQGRRFGVARERNTVDNIIARDKIPDWL